MNSNPMKNTTNQPVTINNETNPHAAIFSASLAVTASAIAPDVHFLSSGLKLDTDIFSKGNINHLNNKDTIDTTPDPYAPEDDTSNASSQDYSSIESSLPYSLRNFKFAHYCTNTTNTMKNRKKKENKTDENFTIGTPPPNAPYAPESDTSNDSAQNSVSTDSYLTYSLRNIKFPSYFLNTTKNRKKKKNKIDNKVTINTNPAPNSPGTDTHNDSDQEAVSADSNSSYSPIYCTFVPYSTTTMKIRTRMEIKLMIK